MPEESLSIQAITLTRRVFESVHGNIGLLKFNIEELTPTNGTNGENSKRWKVICTFFESLGSAFPSRYQVDVNLGDNTVAIRKIMGGETEEEQKFVVTPVSPKETDSK